MSADQSRTVKKIMDQVEGVNLHEKKGKKFNFPIYLNKQMNETPIEALDLSPRPYNCLKRANYNTVGQLTEAAAQGDLLKRIRNCGTKSVREIMEHLFIFQYEQLSPQRQEKFLMEVVKMNTNPAGIAE